SFQRAVYEPTGTTFASNQDVTPGMRALYVATNAVIAMIVTLLRAARRSGRPPLPAMAACREQSPRHKGGGSDARADPLLGATADSGNRGCVGDEGRRRRAVGCSVRQTSIERC